MKTKKFLFKDRIRSFSFAIKGICSALKSQHNLWIHTAVFIIVIALGFHYKIHRYEWITVLIVSAIVFMAEVFNTAIEILVDLVSPQWNYKAGKVKDASAGAVLISAIFAAVIGCIVFLPYIMR